MAPSSLTVVFLVAVNLIPLFGVFFLDWSLFSIMVLYWIENGIIGVFNLFKIALASVPVAGLSAGHAPARLSPMLVMFGKGFSMLFFTFHYGMFWAIHGLFVFLLFGGSGDPFSGTDDPFANPNLPDWWTLAVISLLLSHGVSFFVNFVGKREYLAVSPQQQMGQPYSRVVALHLTIVVGAFLIAILGTPVAALVLLISLKTAIDVRAHLGEHRKAERRVEEADPNDWSSWTETNR